MKVLIIALSVMFLCAAYAWSAIPLLAYPLNRRRGSWVALYCCAIAGFFRMVPYAHYAIEGFFEVAMFTSVARVIAEAAGILEKPRNAWRNRHATPK